MALAVKAYGRPGTMVGMACDMAPEREAEKPLALSASLLTMDVPDQPKSAGENTGVSPLTGVLSETSMLS